MGKEIRGRNKKKTRKGEKEEGSKVVPIVQHVVAAGDEGMCDYNTAACNSKPTADKSSH